MSRIIESNNDRVNVISGGKWILNDVSDLNAAARYVVSIVKYGFLSDGKSSYDSQSGYLSYMAAWWRDTLLPEWIIDRVKSRKYPIENLVITSMKRRSSYNGQTDPHVKDMAVDFYVEPLYLMPTIFDDIAKLYTGGNIYIACPLKGGSVPLHIHYDRDYSMHKNLKGIEFEDTATSGRVAEMSAANAQTVLKVYGLPEHYRQSDAEVTKQAVNDLQDTRYGEKPGFPEELPAPFPWGKLFGAVAVAGLCYGGYRLYKAGYFDSVIKEAKEKMKPHKITHKRKSDGEEVEESEA
jgi:hypothetical protein